MTYAFLIDGLDPEARESLDRTLEQGGDKKAKARRERGAIAALTKLPGVAR